MSQEPAALGLKQRKVETATLALAKGDKIRPPAPQHYQKKGFQKGSSSSKGLKNLSLGKFPEFLMVMSRTLSISETPFGKKKEYLKKPLEGIHTFYSVY